MDNQERYTKERGWSDRFIPEMQQILGTHGVYQASPEQDRNQATDLVIFKADWGINVGCRIRRFGFYAKYPDEFTIRASKGIGNLSELDKILAGFPDLYLYCHASEKEDAIDRYSLINLSAFRVAWFKQDDPGALYRKVYVDPMTDFFAFDINKFPKHMILRRK